MISVYIVEDHTVVIEGIRVLLQNEKDIRIAGFAGTAADCLTYFADQAAGSSPAADVVLMDINLPDMSGVELCRQLKAKYKGVMVLGLSTFNQGIYMNKLMENGASGYLLKNISRQELIDGIRTVNQGGIYFSFEAGKIYKSTIEKNSQKPVLSKREKEIVKLVAEGLTNVQISRQLFISVDTVDTHRKNLYTKLNINNTALLIRYAIDNGIVP
ncbi:MAG: response regulator transcription factor [Bacteroidota bacterium]|nr:response regulator transcription factor [Bacteroidota bacterium]MDP4217070.1 response regulator transcription factor [Bacteroidota bacterium]MDP4244414.1 response regulator transcription factor [Bacteroidota bacterium]MDP4254850.1 response regulator transcription factor [Bacteroidota bacterium]